MVYHSSTLRLHFFLRGEALPCGRFFEPIRFQRVEVVAYLVSFRRRARGPFRKPCSDDFSFCLCLS